MRIMDILLAIPSMLLAIAIVAALGTSITNVLIAIAISYVPTFARTVRASVLTVKDQEFIEAARSIGCSDWRIIIKYVIPIPWRPIIVQVTPGNRQDAILPSQDFPSWASASSRPPLSGAQCCPMPEAISATHGMSPSSRAWESCSPSWPLTWWETD